MNIWDELNDKNTWRSNLKREQAVYKAKLLRNIRQFFEEKSILEVHTPVLGRCTVTNPEIASFSCVDSYLQTSAEYFMKRLLADGFGDIYTIMPVFRSEEKSSIHHHEFTMIEWYRLGIDLSMMMKETFDLIQLVMPNLQISWLRLVDFIDRYLGCRVDQMSTEACYVFLKNNLAITHLTDSSDRKACVDCLYACAIDRSKGSYMVYDFMPEQAALAQIYEHDDGHRYAQRFECIIEGIEIANGYLELLDEKEQRLRFNLDSLERKKRELISYEVDEQLLLALSNGMPSCAGVAIGFDRLLMLALDKESIADVMLFPNG